MTTIMTSEPGPSQAGGAKAASFDQDLRPLPAKIKVMAWVVYALVRLLMASYRFRVVGIDNRERAAAMHAHGSFCLAVWHEHMMASITGHAFQRFAPLSSLSKDGQVAGYILDKLGFRSVRGSSSRGGKAARDELVQLTRQGYFTAITVDGPRGPRHQVKAGAIDIARRTGVAIVPLGALANRARIFTKSWDRFQFPLPFAKIVIYYGPPIWIPPETEGEDFVRLQHEVALAIDAAEAAARAHLQA